ncbi:MAG: 1-acyl-sn-glycerol-3-phosphate acyltransferase [Bacteroidales bacterium]|nr:1-acyl-sn-glycerol-3-phosphate acyltransferase [Bacteroidales bacterium]
MRRIWIFIVRLFGWKFDLPKEKRPELYRAVYIEAPHTSIADFFLGAACVFKIGCNARIFMKKEYFNYLTTPLLRNFGVIPVDRGNRHNNLVEKAVENFAQHEDFVIVLTPEGTRKPAKRWKRGFYEVATQAHVPIVLTYIDFKQKIMGVGPAIQPSGDYAADMREIMKFYQDKTAKHPDWFNKDIIL